MVKGPGKEGERQFQCDRCALRWEELELTHLNATRRPPLGVAWLDERHQTLGEAFLMCMTPARFRGGVAKCAPSIEGPS